METLSGKPANLFPLEIVWLWRSDGSQRELSAEQQWESKRCLVFQVQESMIRKLWEDGKVQNEIPGN